MVSTSALKDTLKSGKVSTLDLCNRFSCSEVEVIISLITLLSKEAKDNYSDENLKVQISIIDLLKEVSNPSLKDLVQKCFSELSIYYRDYYNKSSSCKELFEKLEESIEYININNKETKSLDDTIYELLSYIIFEFKDLYFLIDILSSIKSTINPSSKEGVLLANVKNKYLEALLGDNNDDIIYYEAVINALYNNNLVVHYNDKCFIISEIIDEINITNNSEEIPEDIKKRTINRLNLFIKKLDENSLKKKDVISFIASLSSIDFKENNTIVKEFINKVTSILFEDKYTLSNLNMVRDYLDVFKNLNIDTENFIKLKRAIYFAEKQIIVGMSKPVSKEEESSIYGLKDYFSIKDDNVNYFVDYSPDVLDCTDISTYTIDSSGAAIFDDAVGVKTNEDGTKSLCVFIANPVDFIDKDSLYDKKARSIGKSMHINDNTYYMIPLEEIKNYSLEEKRVNNAIGFFFNFDKDGNYKDYSVKRCNIFVSKNFTYESADANLEARRGGKSHSDLLEISDLANKLNTYNSSLYREEKLKERKEKTSKSGDIISKCMTFVNITVAEFFSKNNYPLLYKKTSLKVNEEALKKLESICDKGDLGKKIREASNKYTFRAITSIPSGHDGIGAPYYTSVTNPLRDYFSLSNLRRVVDFMVDAFDEVNEEELKENEKLANYLTKKRNNMYYYAYNKKSGN